MKNAVCSCINIFISTVFCSLLGKLHLSDVSGHCGLSYIITCLLKKAGKLLLSLNYIFGDNFDDLIYSQAANSNQKIIVSDPVKMYLKEIGRISLLTPEKEKEIAKIIYDTQREK